MRDYESSYPCLKIRGRAHETLHIVRKFSLAAGASRQSLARSIGTARLTRPSVAIQLQSVNKLRCSNFLGKLRPLSNSLRPRAGCKVFVATKLMVQSSDLESAEDHQNKNEAEFPAADANADSADQHRTKKRMPKVSKKGWRAIGTCGILVAVCIALGIFVGVRLLQVYPNPIVSAETALDVCGGTMYPGMCNSTLNGTDLSNPQVYVAVSMQASATTTNKALANLTTARDAWPARSTTQRGIQFSTLQMCIDMYRDCLDAINSSTAIVDQFAFQSRFTQTNDLQQLMSAALTYHFTCLEGLHEHGLWSSAALFQADEITMLLSNALSLVDRLTFFNNVTHPGTTPSRRHRRLLYSTAAPEFELSPHTMEEDETRNFPAWLGKEGRHLLESTSVDAPPADAVVALDGSGDYTSIQAAVNEAPANGTRRYVIHIKRGTYAEQVTVPTAKPNVTFWGDGAGVTVITGNLSTGFNNVSTTFTATVTAQGEGFIAKDLTIRNTAGARGYQAVALRVTAHKSAFKGLSIEGHQDTLYAHANQQFYSQCTIYGTVDYIFGSAAAVFQNCTLLARAGMPGQNITYTASGIASPLIQKHAGLAFLSCTVDAAPGLARNGIANFRAFLGRPWHAYARTAFARSKLGHLVDPKGWSLWNGNSSSVSNVDYGEFANFGPGAETVGRVAWSKQLSQTEANVYSVDNFIKGNLWLPDTGVPYSKSL